MRQTAPTRRIVPYLALPALLPVLFFVNAALPETVLGCTNRGLVALAIALFSGLTALVTAIIALRRQASGNPESTLWIISTLILTLPVVALLKLA